MSKYYEDSDITEIVLTPVEALAGQSVVRRAGAVVAAVAVVFVVLLGRLVWLTTIEESTLAAESENNRTRVVYESAPRGEILDRSGIVLARSVPTFTIAISLFEPLGTEAEKRDFLKQTTKLTASEIETWWQEALKDTKDTGTTWQIVPATLTREEALDMKSEKLPEYVRIGVGSIREYPLAATVSHVLGYVGRADEGELAEFGLKSGESVGKTGLEHAYQRILAGVRREKHLTVSARGVVTDESVVRDALPGDTLTTTLDARLQQKLTESLQTQLAKVKLSRAAAAIMNVNTGEVLAMVSIPSYDNNAFVTPGHQAEVSDYFNHSDRKLLNRITAGQYPPGSIFKPLVATAALLERTITPETSIVGTGGIRLGGRFFGDWKVHGLTDLRRAIAVSSDTYFYALGGGFAGVVGLGGDTIARYARLYGLGAQTGIDLPGEAAGFVPTTEWKKQKFGEAWYQGDSYIYAIGQGYLTLTPLQILRATAAIANGGNLPTPHLMASITNPKGDKTVYQDKSKATVPIPANILQIVREGMRETVTEGTAMSLRSLPVSVAGKTGTAQYGNEDKTYGWFTSFAPYEKPEIAMVVVFEGQSREDTYNAVPVTYEVLNWYFGGRGEKAPDTSSVVPDGASGE